MMKQFVMIAAFSTALAAPVAAQDRPWSVAFDVGVDVPLSGDVHSAGTGFVLGLPTTVEARTYSDIYGQPFTWSVNFGYFATEDGEVRVRLHRTTTSAERIEVGNVATLALFAEFDSYTALGVDFGYRQYFGLEMSRFRPFAGVSVGLADVDVINSTFTVPSAGVILPDVPMYGSSTVPTFGFAGGSRFPVNDNFSIEAGLEFRWQDGLDPVDGLGGTGLEPINDESRRWIMPVTVGAVLHF